MSPCDRGAGAGSGILARCRESYDGATCLSGGTSLARCAGGGGAVAVACGGGLRDCGAGALAGEVLIGDVRDSGSRERVSGKGQNIRRRRV